MQLPTHRAWSGPLETVVDQTFRPEQPMFSLVLPIHNQESIISEGLLRIFLHTYGLYDLFIILDGCTDGTRTEVLRVLTDPPSGLCRWTVVSTPYDIFETSCDNLGFVNARAPYIIELQADMYVETPGYNVRLVVPLELYPDVIAVSGRCCHTFTAPVTGKGKLGSTVSSPHVVSYATMNLFMLSHTVNRGPLALRRSMVESLGYLDEQAFVLENDEHDLFYRAWVQHRWRTGFYPVEVMSPESWGSTRKPRPLHVQERLEARRASARLPQRSKDAPPFPPALETRAMSVRAQVAATQRLLSEPTEAPSRPAPGPPPS